MKDENTLSKNVTLSIKGSSWRTRNTYINYHCTIQLLVQSLMAQFCTEGNKNWGHRRKGIKRFLFDNVLKRFQFDWLSVLVKSEEVFIGKDTIEQKCVSKNIWKKGFFVGEETRNQFIVLTRCSNCTLGQSQSKLLMKKNCRSYLKR